MCSSPSKVAPAVADLAGATGQPVLREQDDAAPFDAQPAAVGELRQRLVDRLATCADELRELFLRQVVLHAHTLVLVLAELVRQVEQCLGHTAGYVAEDEIRH